MTSVGQIEFGMSAAAQAAPRQAVDRGAWAAASIEPGSAPPAAPETGSGENSRAVDERTLDRMALRLVKRDPGLAIEKDDAVRGYVYRFLDAESGETVRQFPADKVLETIRALRQMSDRLATLSESDGVAI